jgi:periplasmic copper chaperone A
MLSRLGTASLLAGASLLFAPTAFAHVSLAGPGYAGQSQVLTFSVGHGCEGSDTYSVEVAIPKEVTTLRAMPSVFGEAEVVADDAGIVSSVKWTKAGKIHAKDDLFYQVAIRISVPMTPFVTLLFPAKQTCRAADGTETVVNWAATAEEVAAAKAGEEPEPAPALVILPVRSTGWNKFTSKTKITDLSIFDDAQIVWVGDAAYSKNTLTADLIKSEDGVTELTEIAANAEIWVKY